MIDFLAGNRMAVVFALAALAASAVIWRSLRRMHDADDINFDLRDLLMENGRVSKAACVMMGSFAATTWFFVYYALNGRMTEGYFGLYIGAWIAPVVARLFKNESADAPGKVTSKTTTETTLETKK